MTKTRIMNVLDPATGLVALLLLACAALPAQDPTKKPTTVAADAEVDALFRDYEGPVRAFLAARLRLRGHDAADAAQDALAWMLQKDLFGKADPARGRFRASGILPSP